MLLEVASDSLVSWDIMLLPKKTEMSLKTSIEKIIKERNQNISGRNGVKTVLSIRLDYGSMSL